MTSNLKLPNLRSNVSVTRSSVVRINAKVNHSALRKSQNVKRKRLLNANSQSVDKMLPLLEELSQTDCFKQLTLKDAMDVLKLHEAAEYVLFVNNNNNLTGSGRIRVENRFTPLFNLLKEDVHLGFFSQDQISELFEAIQNYLFTPAKDIDPRISFYMNDNLELKRKNWNEIETLHRILGCLLTFEHENKGKKDSFKISSKFVRNLIQCINTPDMSEMQSTELLIARVFMIFPETRIDFFIGVREFIDDINNEIVNHICIESILRLLVSFLRNSQFKQLNRINQSKGSLEQSEINSDETLINQKIFNGLLRLFLSPRLTIFYPSLKPLMYIFYLGDRNLIKDSVIYLLRHWPVVNSKKQFSYISHILLTMMDFAPKFESKLLQSIHTKLHETIVSLNITVVLSMIQLLMNPGVVETISVFDQSIKMIIINSLKEISKMSWSKIIREKAEQAIDYLEIELHITFSEFYDLSNSQNDNDEEGGNIGSDDTFKKWEQIKEMADIMWN
ncbi:hypothetical protein TRFO_08528 [Tritrichomonas foetus]|uniref:Phosphoprotein phosphatase n=1 Tax=Tritrichomonas foetus TaxID=1144522 RepID=A0A1J4JJD0_9EUKA|nr:hypothetical protein TRFO_08528 [Tritrichomonas foetus]|eukprot:OHS99270.1 hypothetical protein TRFO_08528 [Tritrichomonas foetus]